MTSVPRIGITCFGTGGAGTGLRTYVDRLIDALEASSLDFEVDLLHSPEDSPGPLDNPRLHCIPFGRAGSGPLAQLRDHHLKLPRWARRREWQAFFAPVERRLPVWLPCRRMATIHDLAAFRLRAKYGWLRGVFNRVLMPRIYGTADILLCNSETTRKDLIAHTGVEEDRLRVARLGVDCELYDDVQQAGDDDVLKRLGIGRPYLLYTSRIEHPGKNHVALLEAFRMLVERGVPHDLVIAGRSCRGADVVRRRISELGLESRVIMTEFVATPDLPVLYRCADVFVFPSLWEGFGLPVLEAMASGTAVACSDVDALMEVGGDAVRTFDPRSPERIAEVVSRLIDSAELRSDLGTRGRARARSFDWNRTTDEIIAVMRSVLGLRAQRAALHASGLTSEVGA